MEPWEMEAQLTVRMTMSRYTSCVDTGSTDALAALFTDECHYDMGGGLIARSSSAIEQPVEELKSMFRKTSNFGRLRHHVSSVTVDFECQDRAKAISYFLAMSRTGPDHWGTYRDEMVRKDDTWLFARRVVTVEGAVPTSPVRSLVVG